MRAAWAKAARDAASTKASLEAAEKEAKQENVLVYDPNEDTISEHSIFMDSLTGIPMGSPKFDKLWQMGGELYYIIEQMLKKHRKML